MQKLGIALVGCGAISKVHLDIIKNNKSAEIVCLVENDEEKARELSKEYNLKIIQDYKEILDREDIDVVHITTPHYNHYEIALEFIKHKKNLLIEKPLTLSVKEAENLMSKNQVKRIPIIEDNKLIGMLTLGDLAANSKINETNLGNTLGCICGCDKKNAQ